MKKTVVFTLMMALIVAIPAYANVHNTAGAKIDAPNLVKITDNLSVGIEGGKDFLNNAFYPDNLEYYEADKGSFAYFKITYSGTLLDLRK